ncbi:MAG: hypothetical protein IKO12_06240 [Bacteroidaceae bacterium]|nr:hypothetical protein [Bacteroidaceae bacterium]
MLFPAGTTPPCCTRGATANLYILGGEVGGKDALPNGDPNPGAEVGYLYGREYGRGQAVVNAFGGTLHHVFGGSNTLGELYGCCNAAAYATPTGKMDPTINVKSFTSIGRIFGGGLGATATVTGNPTVNINQVVGANADMPSTYAGTTIALPDGGSVTLPNHAPGKIGAIGTVFGGGNAAKVYGDTHVNIGTLTTITYASGNDHSPIPVVGPASWAMCSAAVTQLR